MNSHLSGRTRVALKLFKLSLAVVFALPMFAAAQDFSIYRNMVIFNEILAENANKDGDANEVNEFGNTSDWVELYNKTYFDEAEVNINLKGWMLVKAKSETLTEGWQTNLAIPRFVFTNDVILEYDFFDPTNSEARAFLRLWCDKDGTNVTGVRDFHTGFALDKKGEALTLLDAEGKLVDDIEFGMQVTDMSLGRDAEWHTFWELEKPTPVPVEYGSGPCANDTNTPVQLGNSFDLRINEWCPTNWDWWIDIMNHPGDTNAGNCGNCRRDWIELYNTSSNPVVLAYIDYTDTPRSLYLSTNVPGTLATSRQFTKWSYIEGYGYLRLWAIGSNPSYKSDELNIKLSHNQGEAITLSDIDGTTPIHSVTFPGLDKFQWVSSSVVNGKTNAVWYTQGLLPDGDTNNIVVFPVVFTNGNLTVNKSTPGDSNILPLTNGIYINEIFSHTDPPLQDAVELINTSSNAVDISYYWLSNDRNKPKKYQIPVGTIIPAGGYKVIYEYFFNAGFTNGSDPLFTFNSAHGDDCVLYSGDSSGRLTGYRRAEKFDAAGNGVPFGRYTNSQGNVEFVALSQQTFGSSITASSAATLANSNLFFQGAGAPNAYPLVGPVVISEIMYHPPDIITNVWINGALTTVTNDNSDDEYIEIYNMSTNEVCLYDDEPESFAPDASTNRWRLHQTVDYEFSQDKNLNPALRLPPGGCLLFINFYPWASSNSLRFMHFTNVYHIPATFTNIYGPYKGKLGNSGGTLELYRPDYRQQPPHPDAGYSPQILVERVQYNDKTPWPTNADGQGYALQRRFPQGYGNDVTNWAAATPSPGRLPDLRFDSVIRSNNTVNLTFSTYPNVSCIVECTTALSNSAPQSLWTTVSNFPASSTFAIRQVNDALLNNQPRFYRIKSQ